ncbi:MAG: EamA family transporter RarD [Anaerolineae bacterium]|jgi:chloramphenicol-sensitive protein RarD
MKKGTWYAIGAYTIWGLLPVYWKWLQQVPATQLLCHRILWSFLALLIVIGISGRWKAFAATIRKPSVLRPYAVAAVLLGINWLTYVWAVNAGFIVETSLGYFINPLLSVVMGVIFLGERLRSGQWIPVGLAAIGVVYLTAVYGSLPWIALTLAASFGAYGLMKKLAPLDSLYGLAVETGILFLPAVGYLIFVDQTGTGAFLHTGTASALLLVGAGLMTTIPLLMFAAAAQRIPLSVVGLLQYIAPTLQFLLGVLVYGEPFSQARLVGFGIVWVALVIFAIEGMLARRGRPTTEAKAVSGDSP